MFKNIAHLEIVTKTLSDSLAFDIDKLGFSLISRNKIAFPIYDEIAMIQHNDVPIE